MADDVLEKGKGTSLAAHFGKAAAHHLGKAEHHEASAEVHGDMHDACKAAHDHFSKAKKADGAGDGDGDNKVHAQFHKAMMGFHKAKGAHHEKLSKMHKAYGEHCEACGKAAEAMENKSAADKAEADALLKAAGADTAGDLKKTLDELLAKTVSMESALEKMSKEPVADGVHLVPRPGEEVKKAATAGDGGQSGGL